MSRRFRDPPSLLVGGFAAALLALAVAYHLVEMQALSQTTGPLLALSLETGPGVVLLYGAYRLAGSELDAENRWTACSWTLGGAVGFLGVMWATVAVRQLEGREIAEPAFPLLVATLVGAAAGFAAGYHNARARSDVHEARTVADALAFVNRFIRHDLRNDLSAIRGHADLLAEERPAGDGADSADIIGAKADEAMTRIETSGTVAETLVDDPDFERIDLVAVVAEIADGVESTYTVPVSTDLPEEATVVANAGVRSVVDNLIENAVEHNDADDPRVHVAVTRTDETVRLTVRDDGPGLSEAKRESLLEDGLDGGLGLVRTLVDRYGGELSIEDNQPRGAIFVAEFPRPEARSRRSTSGEATPAPD